MMGQPPAGSQVGSPEAAPAVRPTGLSVAGDWTDIEIPGEDDPEIPPWDRRPLMIVIAAGVILVLIGILAGVASAAYFNPGQTIATWHPAGSGAGTPAQGPK